jgi:aryl-alcohol dehydrogenase-like predicted oxidoreductase
LPRFSEDNWDNNQKLAHEFAALAQQKNVAPAQLALGWVLAQGDDIIPIPGTKKRKYLQENAGAVDVNLSAVDLQEIDTLLKKYPDTGQRYYEASLKMTNL